MFGVAQMESLGLVALVRQIVRVLEIVKCLLVQKDVSRSPGCLIQTHRRVSRLRDRFLNHQCPRDSVNHD